MKIKIKNSIWGVPISFLYNYCPSQFEIVWTSDSSRNGRLDVTDAGTAVVSIEYEKSVNDIIFNFDEENDDFCMSGDYMTKELYNMCVRFAVNY